MSTRFASIDARFAALEGSVNSRFVSMENRMTNLENRLDRRLDAMQADLKEFYRLLAEHDKRMSKLEGNP